VSLVATLAWEQALVEVALQHEDVWESLAQPWVQVARLLARAVAVKDVWLLEEEPNDVGHLVAVPSGEVHARNDDGEPAPEAKIHSDVGNNAAPNAFDICTIECNVCSDSTCDAAHASAHAPDHNSKDYSSGTSNDESAESSNEHGDHMPDKCECASHNDEHIVGTFAQLCETPVDDVVRDIVEHEADDGDDAQHVGHACSAPDYPGIDG
jgi:hypothetical protein